MFDLNKTRQELNKARTERAKVEARLKTNDARLRSLATRLDERRRSGAKQAELTKLNAELGRLKEERGGLLERIDGLDRNITDVVGGVILNRPPEELFNGLDGRLPVALLPARLETRYFNNNRELRIRIFPDQVHIDSHLIELTPTERDFGRWYWEKRLDGDAAAAWQELAGRMPAARAAWVVKSLAPTNLKPDGTLPPGTKPAFPDPPERPLNSGRAPRATVLPDRWVAIGFKRLGTNSYQPIFRKWGATVPDALNVGPSFEQLAKITASADEPPVENEMRWMVDYPEALRLGMGITVLDADLAAGNRLANGVDLLLVFGIDWTLTPQQGSASLDRLVQAHLYSEGLAFVPQGAPTNNTSSTRSAYTSDAAAQAAALDPVRLLQVHPEYAASVRLAAALGLPGGPGDLNRAPYANLTEQRTTSILVDALWQSTLGYYLDKMLDPFVTDRMVDLTRDHATRHLQPFGPYAAIRIGPQPYGVLPVVSMKHFKEDRSKGVEVGLFRFLRAASWYWQDGIRDVPYMGRSSNPDDDLLKLLQMTPISSSARYRRALDIETVSNTDGLKQLAMVQADILRSLILPQFASYAGPLFNVAYITQLALYPTHTSLIAPWVQPGELAPGAVLSPNYIAEIAALTRLGTGGQAGLNQRSRSTHALLELLLALAALNELNFSGGRAIHDHLVATGELEAPLAHSSMRIASTLGIYDTAPQAASGQLVVQTPEQLSRLVIPALTGSQAVIDWVATQAYDAPETPAVRNLATFLASLDELSNRPADEIERTFRAVLDCYSHRLDAWFTSLAARRMEAVRKARPTGLHLGGYAWVENLKPNPQPDSLGYVHAPSLTHAAAAALLRSGHLSHRGSEGAALNIDLSSARVRQGLSLIEGIAQGQSFAALLGYRFERGLRERGLTLARFILPFRKIAPLRSTVPETSSAASENIAARDVVDGVALLDRWRALGPALINQVNSQNPTASERTAIEAELRHLEDLVDSVSDIMTAESVFQTVRGNYERAGAALAAFDRQSRPPDPQVVRTPRSGLMYTQRVMLVLQSAALPQAWKNTRSDIRSQVEPRLNAWIARLLGDPARFKFSARLTRRTVNNDGVETTTVVGTPSATLKELDLMPISVVLESVATQAEQPSLLELRLAHLLASKIANPGPDTMLELLDTPPSGAPAGTPGLGELRAFAQMIHSFIANRRSLDAHDLYPPEGEPPIGVDLAELQARLDNLAVPALNKAILDLTSAIASEDATALRAALNLAADLGISDALPGVQPGEADEAAGLKEQAQHALPNLQAVKKRLDSLVSGFAPPPPTDERFAIRTVEFLTAALRTILGEVYPVLPLFTPANVPELSASRAEQNALLGGDPFAPLTWLQQMAQTRPDVDALVSVLTAADVLGRGIKPDETAVMQLPHVAGQQWAGLSLPATSPLLAVTTIGKYSLNQPVAGLICDGWAEMIPARVETTGLTFHYDAPAARPPQMILLAAPPDLTQKSWSFEAVLDTILETFELAKMRLVDGEQIRALGSGMLPAIYLPQDNSYQVPSVDLGHLVKAYEDVLPAKIAGKMFTYGNESE